MRTFRARAEAEAEHAAIVHPRLLSVYDRVEDERRGVVGLVMDLAEDGDLRTALRGPDAPSAVEMFQIADDVLAALDALHTAGLVHRDIKPENVMLERVDGVLRARLGDMGIARPADRTRSTGSVLGTDLYIAPEVHDGAVPSPQADLWALGYVLYEGLFGAPPHADASTTYQAIGRLRSDGPDRPPRVPDAIWNVVAALLAPAPTDRPTSAAGARALLDSARPTAEAGSPLPVTPVALTRRRLTPRGRSVRHVRPRFDPASVTRVLAASAVAVLVVGALAWVGKSDQLPFLGRDASVVGAIESIAPLSAESPSVVPTQYEWRLRHGVLTGRLDVRNPSGVTSDATVMPELFPASASSGGALALVGFNGSTERENDGSTLVRFTVPPLAPHAHHVVRFRVTTRSAANDRTALDQLVRDREAAINRHAFALSDAPTLDHIVVNVEPSLTVGDRSQLSIVGYDNRGEPASAELLRDIRVAVVSGQDVARIDGDNLAALAPGNAVVRAVIGDLQADAPVSVRAAAPPPTTVTTHVVKTHTSTHNTAPTTETTDTTTFTDTDSSSPPESIVV